MSPQVLLKSVKEVFPKLQTLPKADLRLVEGALLLAAELGRHDLLSESEQQSLLKELGAKGGKPAGNSLRAYRLRADLSQQALATLSGINQANISAMEKGKRVIGLNVARKLAKVLRCDYRKLV